MAEQTKAALDLETLVLPRVVARFWAQVDKTEACWLWRPTAHRGAYGSIKINGTQIRAHRLSWLIHNGAMPELGGSHGTCVLHRCDNPACVNPSHLFLGTNADNARDRESKGRTKNIAEARNRWHEAQRAISHCPQGHAYAGANVRFRQNGSRRCAECYRLRTAEYIAKNREQVNARKRANRLVHVEPK